MAESFWLRIRRPSACSVAMISSISTRPCSPRYRFETAASFSIVLKTKLVA